MLALVAALQVAMSGGDTTSPRPITQLVHTTWTAKEGAPTETRALAQTTDGYLWLGTVTGLVRFDGVRFVPFAPRGNDTISTGGIRSLLGASDGSLWIVWSKGGVSQVRDGRVRTYGEKDGIAIAYQIAESRTGTLVAGTAKGLSRFIDGRWQDVNRDWGYPGIECKALWFDRDNALWAETQDRIVYLPSGATRFVDPGMALRLGSAMATFAQARDGTVWIAEVFRSAHTLGRLGEPHPTTEVQVGTWTLLIDRRGSLWIGSAGDGLRRVLDPTAIKGRAIAQFGPEAEQFTEADGLLANVVDAMLEDREGNIWIANSRGIERFREAVFSPIATTESVRPRSVWATRDTTVWSAAYAVDGLQRISSHGVELFRSPFFSFLPTLYQDAAGTIWTVNNGWILRLHRGAFTPLPLRKSPVQQLVDIVVDREGTIWVFDQGMGLLRVVGDSLEQVAQIYDPAFPHGKLYCDRQGRIWVSQQPRVTRYDGGRMTVIGPAEGLPPGGVFSFFEDKAGTLWGAGDGGIGRFEGDRYEVLPEHRGVPGRAAYGIAEDDSGAWWIVTSTGVVRLPPGELERAMDDSGYAIRYRGFDNLDGLPGAISIGSFTSMITRTADGRIWVATDGGLATVDPSSLSAISPPPVLIEGIRVNGADLDPAKTMAIPPGNPNLEIDYTAINLSTPERVRFRYRLEGYDTDWQDVGNRRGAYFSGLPPGTYHLRVSAHNGDGAWGETGALLDFRILPAWYQTLWFKAAIILLIGGVGAALAAMVVRRRHLRAQEVLRSQYEATLAERARIAQDLHDTLLQGFAGVTLQLKAAELALPEQPDIAAETIYRVRQLAHQSLKEARERVWDMRETALGGEDLAAALETFARERTAGTGIEVALIVAGERRRLAGPLEDTAFRIGREAVANAVRHAEARRIEIEVKFGAASVAVEVRDDGRGFTPGQGEEAHRRGHFGLSGMRDRAAYGGGRCEVVTRPGGGTVVTVELPVR